MEIRNYKREEKLDINRRHDLTIEEIRSCSLFDHLSDEQIQEVVDTLKRFTIIILDYYEREKNLLKVL